MAEKKRSFEESMARLEEIVAQLEAGDHPLAESLSLFADELEQAEDFDTAVIALVKRTIRDHRRVIFNGNGYTAEWEAEAAKRGLPNKKNTPAALPALVEPKNIALMEEFGVLTKVEMESRYEVEMEHYSKIINIEALTMLEMARKQLLPAINAYMSEVANTAASKLAVSEHISVRSETKTLEKLSSDADAMSDAIDTLQDAVNAATRVIDDPQYELMTERFGTRMDRPGDVFWDLFRTGNVNREDGNKETIWALQYEFGVPGGQNGNIPTWNAGYPGERAWGPRYWTLLDPTGAAGTLACDSLGRGASYVRPTYYASTAVWKGDEKDMRNSEYNIKRNFYYNNPASSYYKQLITRENLFNEADTIMAFYPYIMKVTDYPHESDYAQAQSFRDVAVMRLAETYLLRAEAYLGMGRKDLAAADINELRKRAHAETMCTEAEVSIDYILDERTRELLTEEFRMLTLCRLGKLYERVVKYNDFKAGKTISEHNNLWAIPQNEIDANTGDVLSFDYDAEHYSRPSNGGSTSTGAAISEARAREIALAQVSGAADSNIRKVELDRDDGRLQYEVKIVYNNMEYDFDIDACTGTILSRDVESVWD